MIETIARQDLVFVAGFFMALSLRQGRLNALIERLLGVANVRARTGTESDRESETETETESEREPESNRETEPDAETTSGEANA